MQKRECESRSFNLFVCGVYTVPIIVDFRIMLCGAVLAVAEAPGW